MSKEVIALRAVEKHERHNRNGGNQRKSLYADSTDLKDDTGAWIKAMRKRLNLSQHAFARKYGLDVRALQNWEQGNRNPGRGSLTLLELISAAPDVIGDVRKKVTEGRLEEV